MSTELTSAAQRSLQLLRRRKLALPALLFVVGHRPLAFAAGQALAVVAPMAALLHFPAVQTWAMLLSAPDGPTMLEAALEEVVRTADAP